LPSFYGRNARRDFTVAGVSILITAAVITFAQTIAKPVMRSAIPHDLPKISQAK
jgi:hypothetical protein